MPVPLAALVELVCVEYGVASLPTYRVRVGVRREAARRVVMWLAYAHGHDTPAIGALFERTPAAVWDMIDRIDYAIGADPQIADRIIGLAARIERARNA
jgi:hypothetical protein